MTGILSELLAAGLIDNIDGDDERITKMEKAAAALAKEFQKQPAELIRAILAGLDPDIPEDDPAIQKAMLALTHEWKSVSSIHTSTPVNLLRAILLKACSQVAEGENAVILWLTSADTLPMMHLGKEEDAIHRLYEKLAIASEEVAIFIPELTSKQRKRSLKKPDLKTVQVNFKVNRKALEAHIAGAVGPSNAAGEALTGGNPQWSNSGSPWSYVFTSKFTTLLANQMDGSFEKISENQASMGAQLLESLDKEMNAQRLSIQKTLEAIEARQQSEQTRLNSLWWSEALYSPSLRKGYRGLPPAVAAVIMSIDLTNVVTKPAPASVGYLLEEAVNRLQDAGFDKEYELHELLTILREARDNIPNDWTDSLISPPDEGRLSLRDLLVLALSDPEWDADEALKRTGLGNDTLISLPRLAHAMFRQEQAVQLAEA